MQTPEMHPVPTWNEDNSQTFLDYGRYFVPDREHQIATICQLIPLRQHPFNVLELCCGEGALAAALLERFPTCTVYGFDGSRDMLQQAQQRLAPYSDRFRPQHFDLAAHDWRHLPWPVHAVVSSLAVHHLDGGQKQELFRDLQRLLTPGGVVVIADVVQPAHPLGVALAAAEWDRAVQQRALELDGHTEALAIFEREGWNMYRHPDPVDKPSRLMEQLLWLEQAGLSDVDVYWMRAGHAIFGGRKAAQD